MAWKKGKGKAFGLNDFINLDGFNKSISQVIKDLIGGVGMDYYFKCTGVASLIIEALQAIKLYVYNFSFLFLFYFGFYLVSLVFVVCLQHCKFKHILFLV